jgi:hypothetical protein
MMEISGMKNRYVCQTCGKGVITVNVDDGTTPFMILCKATKGCKGMMYSSFYSVPQELPAQFEWFRPASLKGYSPEMQEHIQKGGLDLRERHITPRAVDGFQPEPAELKSTVGVLPAKKSRKRRRH